MNVDKLLGWYINELSPIIQVLFIVVLGLIFFLLLLSFRNRKSEGSASDADIGDLEKTLRKVLENTEHLSSSKGTTSGSTTAETSSEATKSGAQKAGEPQVAAAGGAVSAATGAGAVSAANTEQIAKLQAELTAREKRLSEMMERIGQLEKASNEAQEQVKAAQQSASEKVAATDAEGLESKIKDLEARLQEYEIIEDDIANLSLYKEENARLKDEIEKLKTQSGASLEVTSVVTPKAEEIAVDMGLSSEETTKTVEAQPATAAKAENPKFEEIKPEDLSSALSEVANDVFGSVKPPATAAETPPEHRVEPPPPPSQEDLVAQLQAMMDGQNVPNLDIDSLRKEKPDVPADAAQVPTPSVDVTAASTNTASSNSAEESGEPDALKSFDPDKIMEEATHLETQPQAEVAEEGGDPGQKLIDEFENFMKDS